MGPSGAGAGPGLMTQSRFSHNRIFKEGGYKTMTITEIACRLGVSRKGLYKWERVHSDFPARKPDGSMDFSAVKRWRIRKLKEEIAQRKREEAAERAMLIELGIDPDEMAAEIERTLAEWDAETKKYPLPDIDFEDMPARAARKNQVLH